MVAEGCNGFHARFSKSTWEIFNSDCNVQLSTAIQLFNSNSLFQLPQPSRYFQRSTAIETFNHDRRIFNAQLRFKLSTVITTMIQLINAQVRLQLSTAIRLFNAQLDSNFQVRFAFSTSGFSCDRDVLLMVNKNYGTCEVQVQ